MNTPRGLDLALSRFPDNVRRRLAALDRLREIWAEHQTRRPRHRWAEDRRRFFRRHVVELRALAGLLDAKVARAERLSRGWERLDVSPELRERLSQEEEALVRMASECTAGQPLTADYLEALAREIPDFDGPPSPTELAGASLAEAASVETHPVIRAAHIQLICETALEPAVTAGPAPGPPAHRRPLPWAMASLALMRSNYPPLVMDHRLAGQHERARFQAGEWERLVELTLLLADLETASLRGELSWSAQQRDQPPVNTAPLATAIQRRVVEHLRHQAASLALVLRELDSAARFAVSAGVPEGDPVLEERLDAAAERALFTRGPGCWWAALDLTVTDGTLRLLIAVQDVGNPATGVLAVTADALLRTAGSQGDALDLACTDCVTLIPTDGADERWPDVAEFVDDAVSQAVHSLTQAMR
ncbi:hypothetical protein [Marinactinospora rubrisoli]|uniref:Uncharacterized protein n=1 Tax=Marinactinospora rubrisoli TaxID=2715399 RepID=A0ABW2KDE5_9ACTN